MKKEENSSDIKENNPKINFPVFLFLSFINNLHLLPSLILGIQMSDFKEYRAYIL